MSVKKKNVNLRPATKNDLNLLINWGQKLYEVEKVFEPLLFYSSHDSLERYRKELRNPDALLQVIELDGKPVGYFYAHLGLLDYLSTKNKQCEIEVIFLQEEARGKGISNMIIERCIEWAKSRNAFRIKAGIYVSNGASLKTFRKAGFKDYHITLLKYLL